MRDVVRRTHHHQGGGLPLAPASSPAALYVITTRAGCGGFRYPLCGGYPRNAPFSIEDVLKSVPQVIIEEKLLKY